MLTATQTTATETTDEGIYCSCCDEECTTLLPSPEYGDDTLVCPACHAEQAAEVAEEARQEAIDEAQGELDEADGEVETLEAELVELKERLAEARKAAKAAKAKLARLDG